jgi:aminopeptidase
MKKTFVDAYAKLLTIYCCNIKPGDKVLIRSTYLAQPLILACQKQILLAGGVCEFDITLPGVKKQWYEFSTDKQLAHPPILYAHAINEFNVIMSINAPHDLFELESVDDKKLAIAKSSIRPIKKMMMKRGATRDLRWVLCNYPTQSLADAANMSLEKYTDFITKGCFLNHADAQKEWQSLSKQQQHWVDILNQGKIIQFQSETTDISFKIDQRIWINSDGKRNMPSGEVFTSPIETSGEGYIRFDVPSLLFGKVIKGLTLEIKKGKVIQWSCTDGKPLLDRLFSIKGADRVGEIAIGTNHHICEPTLNTLFDEKIGGTIHMAIGASYPETGGRNESGIHHDFIARFNTNAKILLDGTPIYKNGKFIV